MKKAWAKRGNQFFPVEISDQHPQLPNTVHRVCFTPHQGFFTEETNEKFDFPYKIYGIEKEFINRVSRTYKHTKSNLGILLNGVKGTGKTVTAELICNELQLPVIIITEAHDGLSEFINNIQQNVILFFDEYEKMYHNENHSVLTIMDGVLNNGFRRVFLLTTNNLYINDNLLQRPGRIRYLKTFRDLSLASIIEIIEDKLVYPEFKEDLIKFISGLKMITVDIVKAVVEEVNIHKEPPINFKDVINATASDESWDVFVVGAKNKEKIKWKGVKVGPSTNFTEDDLYDDFIINGQRVGEIQMVKDEENILVAPSPTRIGEEPKLVHYKIVPVKTTHRNFNSYVF